MFIRDGCQDIELRNLSDADAEYVMLQEVAPTATFVLHEISTFTPGVNIHSCCCIAACHGTYRWCVHQPQVLLYFSFTIEHINSVWDRFGAFMHDDMLCRRQFVALGGRILRRLSAAACVAMDVATRAALLTLNERLSTLVSAVQAKLDSLDNGSQLFMALGEVSGGGGFDALIVSAVQAFTSPEAAAAVVALIIENGGDGAGWVNDRRPIIALVASAVLGLVSLLEDQSLIREVGWYGLRPLVALAFDTEDDDMSRAAKAALALMAGHAVDTKRFVKDGALQVIIALLLPADPVVRRLGATALARLSSRIENKVLMVQEGALQPLLGLCSNLADVALLQLVSLILANLLDGSIPENIPILVEQAGLPVVVALLSSQENDVRRHAAKIIANVVSIPENRRILLSTDAISLLVSCLALSPTGDTEFYAATTIARIAAEEDVDFRSSIVASGAIQPLLTLAYPSTTRSSSSVSVVTLPTAHFPRHRRSNSDGVLSTQDFPGTDSMRVRARKTAMKALRHIALSEQHHAAIIEASGFRWVLQAFGDHDDNVVREAIRLARQCTTKEDIGPALCEAGALVGLVRLAQHMDETISALALDILASITFRGADVHAIRMAVSQAGVVATISARAATNLNVTHRFAAVQLIANLVDTFETRLNAIEDGALDILMDAVSASAPHAAADRFFAARDINAEVGRALLSVAQEPSTYEVLLEKTLSWLMASVVSPESDDQKSLAVSLTPLVTVPYLMIGFHRCVPCEQPGLMTLVALLHWGMHL